LTAGGAKRRIAVTGGGTAGHILTALEILEAYRREFGAAGYFIGSAAGFETRIVPKHREELELVPGLPWARQGWSGRARSLAVIPAGVVAAARILRRRRTELVIGTGGYVSFVVCLAARCLGIPVVIHEANAVPGLANRLIGRFAALICTAGEETAHAFGRATVVATGMPAGGLRSPGGDPEGPYRILVSGGSEGSPVLDREAPRLLAELRQIVPEFSVLHLTGYRGRADVAAAYQAAGIEATVAPFLEDFDAIYRGIRLAIVCPGARTLAELAAWGIPCVLSPLPGAANDHHAANARLYSKQTGAPVALEGAWDRELLAGWIERALRDPAWRDEYRRRALALARPHAATEIALACERLMGEAGTVPLQNPC
jgi:UDP-N-acetylglucosamine--N-acetylmuramyl-(pentapeptide) pyrophosphoryl-undecaprenol N-acetylglucosamine transferase